VGLLLPLSNLLVKSIWDMHLDPDNVSEERGKERGRRDRRCVRMVWICPAV
jgi:hypothetical protein